MLNTTQALTLALKHHQAGVFAEAEKLYQSILAQKPQHADALHLLGVMANQVGKPQVAAALIGRAIEIAPSVTMYHNNLANALKACGEAAKAETSYRQAILLDRTNAGAHFNLATLFEEQGRKEEARRSYQAAVQCAPAMVEAHIALGRLATADGDSKLALQHCNAAVWCAPEHPPAQNALGNALLENGERESAKACYRRAIALDSSYADAHYNLGNVLREDRDYAAATESYACAIKLSPLQADAYNNMGRTFAEMGRHEEAIGWFNRALDLSPNLLQAHQNRGVSQEAMGDLAAAAASYRQGLELQPDHQDLRTNLGSALVLQGEPEGIRYLEQIAEEQPDSAEAHWWLSAALLLQGDYARGWQEYEWRWKRETFSSPRRAFKQPQWKGEPLEGAVILLHAEQGLGDTLQFIRYAPLVAQRGGTVILEVQPGLHRLLEHLTGVSVCLRQGEPLPDFRYHCPLMSLPSVFGTTMESIPHVHSVWNSDSSPAQVTPGSLRVGLAWAGNPGHLRDRLRSLSLKEFVPLLDGDSVSFVSLQIGEAAAQVAEQEFPFSMVDTSTDLCDTAALIAGLDLVITVDTSIAHLAGSMGKPVWILLATLPDWRWGLHSETTPWYPSARLFRQTQPGSWEDPITKIASELAALVALA
jgi:tetratricopeptide (TPR) repeat protein